MVKKKSRCKAGRGGSRREYCTLVQYLFLFPLVCTVQYVRYRDYIKRDGQLMLGKTKAAAEAEARLRDRLGNVEAVRRASG